MIYSISSGAEGVRVERDTGITPDEAAQISETAGIADVQCFSRSGGFTLVYPKSSESIPNVLAGNEIKWMEGAERFLPINDSNYYETAAFFLSDSVIDILKNYVTDGEIGQYDNGITQLVFDGNAPDFKVGEKLQTVSIDDQYDADTEIFEREATVEAIVTLPQDVAEKYPAIYQIFTKLSDNRNIKFIAPQVNTQFISPLKSNYDLTVAKYADNADWEQIFSGIKQAARSDQ